MKKIKRKVKPHIFELEDGTYMVRIDAGRVRRKSGFRTIRDAEDWLHENRTIKATELARRKRPITFDELSRRLEDYILSHKSLIYWKSIRQALDKLRDFTGGSVHDIRRGDVDRFIAHLADGLSITTVNKTIRHLKAAFGYATKWELIQVNPFAGVSRLTEPDKELKILSDVEIKRLFNALEHNCIKRPNYRMKWICRIILGLEGGLRPAEVNAFEWSDLDFTTGAVMVQNKIEPNSKGKKFTTKSKRNRVVYVQLESIKYFKQLHEVCAGENPLSYFRVDNFSKWFKPIANRAGVDCTFYDLRRTCATRLAEHVAPAVLKEWMGHKSIATTEKYYVNIQRRALAAVREVRGPSPVRLIG